MKHYISSFLIAVFMLSLGTVNAASIKYQSRSITNTVDSSDYRSSWLAQTSQITNTTLPEFSTQKGGNNRFSRLIVDFTSGLTSLSFQLAVDATYGGAIYLDNMLLTKNTSDLWWNLNWNNTSEILSATTIPVGFGNHTLEVFWAEHCCNGNNSGRFSVGGSKQWQTLSSQTLQTIEPVPIPAAVWLFSSAMAGLLGLNRKRMQSSRIISV
jgi:hypothetical protein